MADDKTETNKYAKIKEVLKETYEPLNNTYQDKLIQAYLNLRRKYCTTDNGRISYKSLDDKTTADKFGADLAKSVADIAMSAAKGFKEDGSADFDVLGKDPEGAFYNTTMLESIIGVNYETLVNFFKKPKNLQDETAFKVINSFKAGLEDKQQKMTYGTIKKEDKEGILAYLDETSRKYVDPTKLASAEEMIDLLKLYNANGHLTKELVADREWAMPEEKADATSAINSAAKKKP